MITPAIQLSSAYVDAANAPKPLGVRIYPTWESFRAEFPKDARRRFAEDKNIQTMSDHEVIRQYGDRDPTPFYPKFGLTPSEFIETRNRIIELLVEQPCQNLVRRLLDYGLFTYSANAKGIGPKGVYWANQLRGEGRKVYFTSLANGQTYKVDGKPYSHDPVGFKLDIEKTRSIKADDTLPHGKLEISEKVLGLA